MQPQQLCIAIDLMAVEVQDMVLIWELYALRRGHMPYMRASSSTNQQQQREDASAASSCVISLAAAIVMHILVQLRHVPQTAKTLHLCALSCVLSCRLHFDPSTGTIKDQWTWRGATADEAAWLLSRSYKHLNVDAFLGTATSGSSNSGSGRSAVDGDEAQRARAKGAALAFREVFGAVPGANVANLTTALSDDYQCKVG